MGQLCSLIPRIFFQQQLLVYDFEIPVIRVLSFAHPYKYTSTSCDLIGIHFRCSYSKVFHLHTIRLLSMLPISMPHEMRWWRPGGGPSPTSLQWLTSKSGTSNTDPSVVWGVGPSPTSLQWLTRHQIDPSVVLPGWPSVLEVFRESFADNKGGALSAVCVQCAHSATIWPFGRSRSPYFGVFWASLLFGSRF